MPFLYLIYLLLPYMTKYTHTEPYKAEWQLCVSSVLTSITHTVFMGFVRFLL
jgi:hypothetical protein